MECVAGGVARGDVKVMKGERLGHGASDEVWNGVAVLGTKRTRGGRGRLETRGGDPRVRPSLEERVDDGLGG